MSLFPSVLTSFSTKVNGQIIDAADINNPQTDITQIEATIGAANDASVVGTMQYDLRSPASGGGGHVQTVNKGGTGQISYNKGDILVGQSSSVLSKLAVGSDGGILIADSTTNVGLKWTTQGIATVTSFLSNGIWTKPAGIAFTDVECWGAGGSGGLNSATSGGGGGGGGGYIIGRFSTSLLGATEAVNIGVGGASVASNGSGNTGGNTVFGTSSLLVAYGGGGGGGNTSSNNPGAGGGGGVFGAGVTGISSTAGMGGKPATTTQNGVGAGAWSQDNSMGGGGGGSGGLNGGYAVWGGGGGGSGGTVSCGNGGNSFYGGAGGGGGANSGTAGGGGISKFGGTGGDGGTGSGIAGSVAGGGGGGAGSGKSGAGANGKVVVTAYY